jgi:hypothetical protein
MGVVAVGVCRLIEFLPWVLSPLPRSCCANENATLEIEAAFGVPIQFTGRAQSAAPPGENRMWIRKIHGWHGCSLTRRCQPPPLESLLLPRLLCQFGAMLDFSLQ